MTLRSCAFTICWLEEGDGGGRWAIRPALIKALGLYRRLAQGWLELKGVHAEEVAGERIVSGQTWDEFCETLKAAGASVNGMGAPSDPLTQAEGYRYLSRLLRAGLEAFLEYADPRAPVLRRMVHETVKMGSDNPDNYYQNATISGQYEYRLYGTRGTVHFLGLSTQKGGYGQGGGLPPTGFLDASEIQIDDEGNFEVFLSTESQPGNWLPMERETGLLIVRQTFLDREQEQPAELTIERIGGDGKPSPLSVEQVDHGLSQASNLVAGASLLFAKWAKDFQKHTNELPLFDPEKSTAAGGDQNIAYYHSYWKLAADEALLVEIKPPECDTWNFQLNNHFMESLDYRFHTIHLNKHSAAYEPDGSVRIVVSQGNPGCPNWLETDGHSQGTMCLRWIKAEEHPTPRTRVVKLSELDERKNRFAE